MMKPVTNYIAEPATAKQTDSTPPFTGDTPMAEPLAGDIFDIDRIRSLIELMQEYDLSEIDLRQSEQRIQLKRGAEPVIVGAAPTSLPAAHPPNAANQAAAPAALAESKDIVTIKSPMVGTFYAKASPDADLFVKVGDHVDPDTTVCIIEAMKVFNEINAEVSGEIVAILVDNEDPVEFNKPLYKVDTSK